MPEYCCQRIALIHSMVLLTMVAVESLAAEKEELPKPFATPSTIKHPKVIGWPSDRQPSAPAGFKVSRFGKSLESPRWLYVLPNGDVLVAQSRTLPKPNKDNSTSKAEKQAEGLKESKTVTGESPNRITLLRDKDQDGQPETTTLFVENLKQPFGMAHREGALFIAATDAVWVYPYRVGQSKLEGEPKKIVDLPAGGYNNHWTRNLLIDEAKEKLYISVGSASNVAEHGMEEERLRANILECNLDGTDLRVFASGLRNPVGMAWEPENGSLWTVVNERDELGDDLVPDYLTSVRDGGFYGWPYSYFGSHEDPRRKGERPDLVDQALIPDLPLGAHTASLGLTFYTANAFPEKFRGGALIGQRGSWNRSQFVGYRVAFVPFQDGKPSGPVEPFLTGFIANEDEVYGRPVGVVVLKDGSLLVADEPGNILWRISAN